jgi:hypothetical protein
MNLSSGPQIVGDEQDQEDVGKPISVVYAATVISGVQPGNSLGNVPVTAVGAPASITG